MKLHLSEIALLTDLASAKDYWTSAALEAVSSPERCQWLQNTQAWSKLAGCVDTAASKEAFATAISEVLSGLVHSVLVSFDGGSALADISRLTIQDDKGYGFKQFLHEYWPEYADSVRG
jgi:hypothetical protein